MAKSSFDITAEFKERSTDIEARFVLAISISHRRPIIFAVGNRQNFSCVKLGCRVGGQAADQKKDRRRG